jgi:hypothetical protein
MTRFSYFSIVFTMKILQTWLLTFSKRYFIWDRRIRLKRNSKLGMKKKNTNRQVLTPQVIEYHNLLNLTIDLIRLSKRVRSNRKKHKMSRKLSQSWKSVRIRNNIINRSMEVMLDIKINLCLTLHATFHLW